MRALWFIAGSVAVASVVIGSVVMPLDHEAIRYSSAPLTDDIIKLQTKLDQGKAKLAYDAQFGFLPAVLDQLDVPRESQILVFSKTSFQAARISPKTPRALYFNDAVSIGYVPGGDVVEVLAQDPKQGVVFYTLDQDPNRKPQFIRHGDTCLQCHMNGSTHDVPGLVIRSVYPERSGMPHFHAGGFVTDHRSPLKERWGGWYVTGTHGEQRHMGNAFAADRAKPNQLDFEGTSNVQKLTGRFDTSLHLTPYSDIVALMVIEHQARMMNLLTRLNFETRLAEHHQSLMTKLLGETSPETRASTDRRIRQFADELVDYALFVNEAPLAGPVRGTSGFAERFAKSGPLREFDLNRRLFKHRLSYMIFTPAFDQLPPTAHRYVRARMQHLLADPARAELLAIVKREKPELLRP